MVIPKLQLQFVSLKSKINQIKTRVQMHMTYMHATDLPLSPSLILSQTDLDHNRKTVRQWSLRVL